MIFNVALVVAAVIGAAILPANGVSVPIIVGLAVAYALLGVWFALVSRSLSMDEGTESLRGEAADPAPAPDPRPSDSRGSARAVRESHPRSTCRLRG